MNARRTTRLWILLLVTSIPLMWLGWSWALRDDTQAEHDARAMPIKVHLSDVKDRADLIRNDDGTYMYVLFGPGNTRETLTPEQFAQRQYTDRTSHGVLATVFNVTSPLGLIWVSVGLLGQVLFTGRMVVQWLVSEKRRQSVVPTMFWWMSLLGAIMLLSYFIWRRDIVGVLGQSFGMFIYIRNLHLIYRSKRLAASGESNAVPLNQPG